MQLLDPMVVMFTFLSASLLNPKSGWSVDSRRSELHNRRGGYAQQYDSGSFNAHRVLHPQLNLMDRTRMKSTGLIYDADDDSTPVNNPLGLARESNWVGRFQARSNPESKANVRQQQHRARSETVSGKDLYALHFTQQTRANQSHRTKFSRPRGSKSAQSEGTAGQTASGTNVNTTQTRWWLDTIAKLLHSHPLVTDTQSRLYSNSVIDLDLNTDYRSDAAAISPYEEAPTTWNDPVAFGQNTFPESNTIGSIHHGSPAVVGWRKQQLSSTQTNPLLTNEQIRERIQLYRKLMSPKQWKQFLAQTMPGQNQAQFNLALFEATVIGVRRAVAECRYQFRNERWNCSQVPNTDTLLFGNLLLKGIPQTAFVYSIINAGIVQSVAEACLGRIDNCPCNNHGRETSTSNWQWQGCDHNIHYSRKFSRRLLDTMEQGSHIRFRMNLHNNKVGRQLVMKHMERYCRCHGTSGSCTLRTCYRRTPRMRTIGQLLKQIYETNSVRIHSDAAFLTSDQSKTQIKKTSTRPATFLKFNPSTSSRHYYQRDSGHIKGVLKYASSTPWRQYGYVNDDPDPRTPLAITSQSQRLLNIIPNGQNSTNHVSRTQLVYYETVPHSLFCEANPRLHLLGTHHRVCNSSSSGPDNCEQLCCGRGFLTNHYYTMESCNCKFIWCCRVQCQQCLVLKKVETCL